MLWRWLELSWEAALGGAGGGEDSDGLASVGGTGCWAAEKTGRNKDHKKSEVNRKRMCGKLRRERLTTDWIVFGKREDALGRRRQRSLVFLFFLGDVIVVVFQKIAVFI